MLQNKEIVIYSVKLPDDVVPVAEVGRRVDVLNAEERQMYDRYKVDFKKVEFLIGRLLLKKTLSDLTGIAPERVEFVKNEYGKLFLHPSIRPAEPLHFNLSHAGKMVVAAFTRYSEVGVDVEETTKDHFDLMPSVYQPHEIAFVEGQPEEKRRDAFYLLWTRKEAYMKAEGKGMSIPPISFTVPLEWGRSSLGNWEYDTFVPHEEYLVSTSLLKQPGDELTYEVRPLDWQALLDS